MKRFVTLATLCMAALFLAALCMVGNALAAPEPAPRPPGWPSDLCVAEGVNSLNPLCGTCSTSVWYPQEGVGTLIQWTCKTPTGEWMTHGLIRPWMTPWIKPSMTDIVLKGPWAAIWDANAVRPSSEDATKYAALETKAKPWITTTVRPPEAAPASWVVTPVSTGLRPSYTVPAGAPGPLRESGQFAPVLTAGKPTACDCDGPDNSVMLASQKLCAVRGLKTAAGAQRFTACQAAK